MRVWVVLGLLWLVGCATSNVPGAYWRTWKRDTPWGHVEVKEQRLRDGRCTVRIVEFRRDVGLYVDEKPFHLKAMDVNCDDQFDYYQTRDHRLANLVMERGQEVLASLDEFLLFLMYSTIPIE